MDLKAIFEVDNTSGFGLNNLPYGVFSPKNSQDKHIGVAFGEYILDLHEVSSLFIGPLMKDVADRVFKKDTLNEYMSLQPEHWSETRCYLQKMLGSNDSFLKRDASLAQRAFHKQSDCTMRLPVTIGDYTDFYASIDHARNVGCLFRGPDNALMPNYKHMPIAYHGRASSIVVSGQDVVRPNGQYLPLDATNPEFGPCKALDFELEMGIFIGGPANDLGKPVSIEDSNRRIFGLVLMNDLSARDIQKWEYQPLGPFLSKSFATSISPWIVTMDALKPFQTANRPQDPKPLPYLQDNEEFNYDINLSIRYTPVESNDSYIITNTNFKYLYWSMKQMVCHHSVNGCNLRPGDMFGTGTISGPSKGSEGSLLELTKNSKEPIMLKDRELKFIKDGDTISIEGSCGVGSSRVSFGSCSTKIVSRN